MKDRRKYVVILLLALLMLPLLPFLNGYVESAEAQTADPIDAGIISNLKTKVNATYARGPSWSVKYEDGVYKWRSEPLWIWSKEEQKYVPYIFRDKYMSDGYFEVSSGLISARIYESYAMFFAPENFSDVRLYQEQWEVQQWNPKNNKWAAVIGSYSTFEGYLIKKDEKCINVTMQYSSWAGWLNITYTFHEGDPLKHTVVFKSALDYETDFRVIQKWAGIVAAKVKHSKGEDAITSAKAIDSSWFRFEKADGRLSVFEDQWSMYYGFNEMTGEVYVKANENLKPVEIDVHAQGLKADFVFGNWTLKTDGSLEIDPETYTATPPTKDTYIRQYYPTSNYGDSTSMSVVSHANDNERSLVEFDISSIPGNAQVTSAILKLYVSASPDGSNRTYRIYRITSSWEEMSVTWNTQPSYSSDYVDQTIAHDTVDYWWSPEVTSIFQLDNTIGFMIKDANEDSGSEIKGRFRTKEYDGYDPQLEVTYFVNTAPNAPALNSPAANARYDPSENVQFTWTFNDPDSGDSQSRFTVSLQIPAGR